MLDEARHCGCETSVPTAAHDADRAVEALSHRHSTFSEARRCCSGSITTERQPCFWHPFVATKEHSGNRKEEVEGREKERGCDGVVKRYILFPRLLFTHREQDTDAMKPFAATWALLLAALAISNRSRRAWHVRQKRCGLVCSGVRLMTSACVIAGACALVPSPLLSRVALRRGWCPNSIPAASGASNVGRLYASIQRRSAQMCSSPSQADKNNSVLGGDVREGDTRFTGTPKISKDGRFASYMLCLLVLKRPTLCTEISHLA
jgi:hypothetical protein